MNNLLAQIVLARQDPGWINILVVVVMAIVWIIGGIVKATRTKSGDEQQPSRVPSRKPPAHSRGAQQQMPGRAQRPVGPAQRPEQLSGAPKKRTTLADLRATARKFAAEAEQAFQVQMPKPQKPSPQPKPEIRPVATLSVEPVATIVKNLDDKQAAAADVQRTQYLADLLSDYTDPEKLRRAIIHYEILGPPLSMRD